MNRTEEEMARLACRYALGGIPGDWPRFSTTSILMALNMVELEHRRMRREPGLVLGLDAARSTLTEALTAGRPAR